MYHDAPAHPAYGFFSWSMKTDGAQFNLAHKMVRFTPDNRRADHNDPSYHLPAFYELWARWGAQADRPFWAEAARVSRAAN